MRELPVTPSTGVMVTVRFGPGSAKTMLGTGTGDSLVDVAVIVSTAYSGSLTVKGMAGVRVSCGVVWFAMDETVGAPTMNRKVRVAVLLSPSVTMTVISADPCWPAAGVTETVRFEPAPPREILPKGTRI